MLNLRCFSRRAFHQNVSVTVLAILICFQVEGRRGREKNPCYEPEKILIYWQNSPSAFSSVVVYHWVCVSHTWSLVSEVPEWLFTDRWKLWMPMVWVLFTDAPFWKSYFFIFFTPWKRGDMSNILQWPVLKLHRKKLYTILNYAKKQCMNEEIFLLCIFNLNLIQTHYSHAYGKCANIIYRFLLGTFFFL